MPKFKDPAKPDKPFEFPESVLRQIDECAPDGFVLFYINSVGDVDVRLNFAHGMAEGAIRDFGARFFNSITQSLDIQEVQGFLEGKQAPDEEDEL